MVINEVIFQLMVINVGKTIYNKPAMTGNGNHTTY
jgi:hypothetical protein